MTAPRPAEGHSVVPASDGRPIFVDTNVLLNAIDEADLKKHHAARRWRAELWKSRRGRLSFQVLGEFYVNAVRKQPAAQDEARAEVRDLLAWNPVIADAALLERGWKLQDRYQLSYWDALIVAAAKAASCHYLLTEDLQTGQMLDGIEVVNPFLRDPESLL
jgi:predicted nucleic acid-binding protein